MIPNKVKALFQFIDYLDGNKKKYIKTYIPLVKEIKELNQKIYALDLDESNYKNKQKADRYYNERLPKYTQLNIDVIQPILNKLKELDIWQGDEVFTSIYNANIKEIRELTEEFTDNDVKTIQQYNQKYIDFRTETNCYFLNLGLMFDYLDRVLKVLFDFFKDSTKNEFEAFEIKAIPVNSIAEAIQGFKKGQTKFTLPANFLFNTSTNEPPQKDAPPPQPIDKKQNRTKQVISETFENMDKKGWEYAFTSEQDYNLFTDLLTNFFEYKDYSIPETPIQLKRGCKTKVAKALGEIHKELSNENKLTTDTNYFNLIRVLSHFESEKQNDLYKALTR